MSTVQFQAVAGRSTRFRQRVATGIFAVALLSTAASGAQDQRFAERVEVARILLDVRVVDNAGRPVRGLGPDDFQVRVGAKNLRVESVQWVGGEAARREPRLDGTPGPAGGIGAPEMPSPGRTIVFLVQKSLEGGRVVGLLRMLRDSDTLLARLAPHDRVAVLSFENHLKIWLDFTSDMNRVHDVLAHHVMLETDGPVEPAREPSLVARLSQATGRKTYSIEEALHSLAKALEPLPGAKSLILVGYGFGRLGPTGLSMENRYDDSRAALQRARVTVFSLDVTDADYHTLEGGLKSVSFDTGGFFARTHIFPEHALNQVAEALEGHYVLFAEKPDMDAGVHALRIRLPKAKGTVMSRSTYTQ